ncbi:1587_t:CDS:1, partial [Entrophospora sp. SA101]
TKLTIIIMIAFASVVVAAVIVDTVKISTTAIKNNLLSCLSKLLPFGSGS